MKYTFKIRPHDYLRKTVLEIKENDKAEKIVLFNNRKEAINFSGRLYLKYPGIEQELNKYANKK